MGRYGHSRTPGQGQDTRQERGIWSVEMVVKAESLLSSESSARMPFGPFSLVGLCPTLPIFLKLPKLPKLSPSRMGHYGQSQTPGQGQDTAYYPAESNVTAIIRVVGVQSRQRECLLGLLALLGL